MAVLVEYGAVDKALPSCMTECLKGQYICAFGGAVRGFVEDICHLFMMMYINCLSLLNLFRYH